SGRTAKDRSTIANSVRLLKLPAMIQDALVQKTISAGHARALLSLDSMEEQVSTLKDIVKKRLNVRQTENAVKTIKRVPSDSVKPKKSSDIIEVENKLSKTMMTSVKINQRSTGGTIQIRYRDSEDLDRLIRHMVDV
ncbi:MAG: hypothetical protein KJN62_08570, partial [Deltaproteobacteria bacterium]|nr:hypothetical protein [Deltaproteobacteria bacterium]